MAHALTTAALFCCLALTACSRKREGPVIDGVTTSISLVHTFIRSHDSLRARLIFRNTTPLPVTFQTLDPGVNAFIYKGGRRLGLMCPTTDDPVIPYTLGPGQILEITAEIFTPRCYDLAPGVYSIRFFYPLGLIANDEERANFRSQYSDPEFGLIPWDGAEHRFVVW